MGTGEPWVQAGGWHEFRNQIISEYRAPTVMFRSAQERGLSLGIELAQGVEKEAVHSLGEVATSKVSQGVSGNLFTSPSEVSQDGLRISEI